MDDAARARSHERAIEDTIAALRAAPDATVPFYPEWRVRDLVVRVDDPSGVVAEFEAFIGRLRRPAAPRV